MDEWKMVLPGEQVATVEEYEPGEGTYEAEGKVFAGWVGVLQLDGTNKVVRVRPFNPPAELREGDIVYGSIGDLRPAMATAQILAIHGRRREVAGEVEGSLHISRVANGYTDSFETNIRLGDVIRARVDQVAPSVQISTQDPNLGVVRALCGNCRSPMKRLGDGEVKCPKCDRVERRKMAADYGELQLDGVIQVAEPAPREPRGDRPPRREYGDRDRGDRDRGGRDRGGRDRGGRGGGDRDRRGSRGGGGGRGGFRRGGGRGGGGRSDGGGRGFSR